MITIIAPHGLTESIELNKAHIATIALYTIVV